MNLSDNTYRKFIETEDVNDYQVLTEDGYKDILYSNKTVEYDVWRVETENGHYIECADTHILIDVEGKEVYAKDSNGITLNTIDGPSLVVSVQQLDIPKENMYDLSIDSDNHTYYVNDILSHNSISTVIYILWYAVFHPEKTIAILANKGATAREMLSRVTLALENLPFFLQPGCKALNKGNITFGNNTKIIAAATSGSSIRGLSVNLLFLDEFAFVENASEFYTSTYPVVSSGKSTKVIITSTANGVGNIFHRLYEGAAQNKNEFKPFRVDWWDVPGRDEDWKKQTVANTSELQFDQEFGNCLETNSEITIRINSCNEVYRIKIGDLYDCIRSKGACGISIDEEIRLKAICRIDDKENQSFTTSLDILTPSGFQPFDAVKKYTHDEHVEFKYDDDSILKCALKHRFIIDGEERYADTLVEGDTVAKSKVIKSITRVLGEIELFDPINVANGSIYCHDNVFVSHNSFHGRSNTLINSDAILGLQSESPIERRNGISYYEKPKAGHTYVMCVDVSKGRGQDYSTFNIFDVQKDRFKQVCTFRDNMISPLIFPDIIVKVASAYNDAVVLIENNDVGHVVCNAVYYEYEYENTFVESSTKAGGIGVSMNKRIKRIGCSNLKDLVEQGKLSVIDADTIGEIATFEARGSSYQATDGNHDDLVMNLVLFSWFISSDAFGHILDMDLKSMLYEDRMREMEDDLLPFGFIDNNHTRATSDALDTVVQQQKSWMDI